MAARTLNAATVALPAAALALLLGSGTASAYEVRSGDTLWGISHRTGVPVERIARDNGIADPNRIFPGQRLDLGGGGPASATESPEPVSGAAARALLVAAARERGLNPNFVLAVSLWESGCNQAMTSVDGAIGLMQIMPATARWAGPALLGRSVDVHRAADNARLGAALLRRYVDEFDDPRLALAAYYQGERGTREDGIYPSSRGYVDGIWALRNRLQAGGSR